jgi:hypothetical protein
MGLRILTTGGVVALLAALNGHAAADRVELTRAGSRIDVQVDGRAFASYQFDPSIAKPFFFPLRSAAGTIVTRGYPMTTAIAGDERDEPHQRAMYFGHGDINGFDFWGEEAFAKWSDHDAATFGRTVFRSIDEIRSGEEAGYLVATFDLATPSGVIGEEVQKYRFSGDDRSRTVDCTFMIHATRGRLTLGDTKEGTFAVRVAKELHPPSGRMLNADGAVGEKRIWGKRANWVDYSGRVAGEDVGVAIFDHPQNARTPAYWHARGYGLLAANPFGLRQFTGDRRQDGSYTIPGGGSLVLRYRVLVHHGDASQAGVAGAYRRFVEEQ